ncbi:F0F1 ATP synthase subunit gamma [Candidatus Woesebacteria bacterium]|nr:F0F1 ATP synthase subunit gamma [Candidatus Woesebacteria bacterium]
MTNSREIQAIIDELQLLQTVTQAYGEIASLRMKNTRQNVLSNRAFLEELRDVFEDVRISYVEEVYRLAHRKRGNGKEEVTFLGHNGKSVAVLLSANSGLYGDIVRKTFDAFLTEVRASDAEVTIIGQQGLSYFEAVEPKRPHTYFELPDNGFTTESGSKIIKHIVKYKEIHLFYGKFQNVLIQKPERTMISSQIDIDALQIKDRTKYLFEPSLDSILKFFETEMFASLFEQVVRESQLAKFASRILAMDQASENIKVERRKLMWQKLAAQHRLSDRKQLNTLPAILMTTG